MITSVNFLLHFFNNWSMLSAKLWANSVYSSLKIRFSHRDPDVPLENLEPLEPFQTHRSAQNLPEDISDEAMSIVKNILEPSLKSPCSTAPLPNYIPDMIHLQQKLDGKGYFCLWLVSFVIFCPYLYLWPGRKTS